MMLCEEALRLVQDALNKGREMRRQQKRYFATRTPAALTDAKNAERRFDNALAEAEYAITHNAPRPKQQDLFGGVL